MSLTTPARTKMGSKLMALTLAAGLLAGPIAVDAAPAEAATKKCAVKMSNSKPRQYSNTWVTVSKVGSKAKVETIAHYKTTMRMASNHSSRMEASPICCLLATG